MGQFGDKTYESDYIEDIIDEYSLDPDFREDRLLTSLELGEILREEGDDELIFLGIVSFIIDTYDNHKILLSPRDLRKALQYAGNLLLNFNYACNWFINWNDRIDAIEEEMRNIYNLLDFSFPFDFSKYERIDQGSLLDIENWEKFDEDHQFYVISHFVEGPFPPSGSKFIAILKEDIKKSQAKSSIENSSRLVLAAIALSRIDGQDAIKVIFENADSSFSWVKKTAKEYLTERLKVEKDQQVRIKINEIISSLKV